MNIQEFKKLARKYFHVSFDKSQYENDKAYSKIQEKRDDLDYYARNVHDAAQEVKRKGKSAIEWYVGPMTFIVMSSLIGAGIFANPIVDIIGTIGIVLASSVATFFALKAITNPNNIAKSYERRVDRYNKKSEKLLNQQRVIMEKYFDKEQVEFLIAEQKLEYFAVKKVWEELRQEFEGNAQEAEQPKEVKPVIKNEQEEEQERD